MIREKIELLRQDWEFLRKLRRTGDWEVVDLYYDTVTNLLATHKSGIYFTYDGTDSIFYSPFFYCDKNSNPVYFRTPFLLMAFLMRKHIRRIHMMHLLSR